MTLLNISWLDALALAVFLICWLGFGTFAEWMVRRRTCLMSAVRNFRQAWIQRMCERENHVADATLLSNLLRGALFLASTTVFILGGLAALLGTSSKVAEVITQLPYATPATPQLAEIKALFLIFVFVYAFFKFTWSAWQYNVLAILVGAMPTPGSDAGVIKEYGEAAARVLALAGESYNNGMRAYYFSIPLMAWFLDPILFLAATLVIALVLYRREFHSPILAAIKEVKP